MSKEERYVEHIAAWELPNGDSVTKSNYNLADIETKYMPIQTEVICDDKDKTITDLKAKLAELREQIAICDEENGKTFIQCFNAMRENVELKQQLAEKDKEIKQLKLDLGMFRSVNE